MLVSTLVHPDSPLRGAAWPSVADITDNFGTSRFGSGHASSVWFQAVTEWLERCCVSEREMWSIVMAYAGRQLRYEDVTTDDGVRERVLAIAAQAANYLSDT